MMAASKPSSSLSKYLDTKKHDTRLIGPIERYLISRPKEDRRTDVIHPSDLCKRDFCARAYYFKVVGKAPVEDNPNLRLQNIFDEGHAIHAKWQSRIGEMGNLYGKWKCLNCHHTFWAQSPFHCHSCGSDLLKYAEVGLIDDDLLLAGHADGWVRGLGADFFLEVKSVGPGTIRMEQPALIIDTDVETAWKNIRRPFPTYLRQGFLYLEIAHMMEAKGLLEYPAPNEIVFIMELKLNQAYKEFVVQRNADIAKDMLDTAFDIQYAVRTSHVAPTCSQSTTGSCKACAPFSELVG
jgi:hypothetical protein